MVMLMKERWYNRCGKRTSDRDQGVGEGGEGGGGVKGGGRTSHDVNMHGDWKCC